MSVTTRLMSADEFLDLPPSLDGSRVELMEGEVLLSPSPNAAHVRAAAQLSTLLIVHVAEGDQQVMLPPFEELTIPLGRLWLRS